MIATAEAPRPHGPEYRPYQPRGSCLEMFYAREPEVLLAGPAGTGKSLACLSKLWMLAGKYPGMRGLICRKTRESITESALYTWEDQVVPPALLPMFGNARRSHRQIYHFPNGSEIIVGGMDKASKVMSSEYDAVFIQESTELEENDWESLTTRLRRGVMPYQQLIADCNPDKPTHWLKRRCDTGKTRMLESRHTDNPTLWDADKGDWTPVGVKYIAILDALTGSRKQRLRFGRWVQAEGVIYEGWDTTIHLRPRRPIPVDWPRYISIDFGLKNPFVALFWAQDPDGRLWMYREIYHTNRLVEDHARTILDLMLQEANAYKRAELKRCDALNLPPAQTKSLLDAIDRQLKPKAIVCDHDAEGRATLERYLKMSTTAAIKEVLPGIEAVASRLRVQADGSPRLLVLRDSLVAKDMELDAAKLPTCLVEEVDGYVWDTRNSVRRGEQPLKENDHAMDSVRYMAMHVEPGNFAKLQF